MKMTERLALLTESKRRNAAAEARYSGASWKQMQLHALAYNYGRLAERWQREEYHDDRDVYVRTYHMMMTGIKSLMAHPDLYVRVAMGDQLRKDRALLDRIARAFGEKPGK
jgi:hypothetical protein